MLSACPFVSKWAFEWKPLILQNLLRRFNSLFTAVFEKSPGLVMSSKLPLYFPDCVRNVLRYSFSLVTFKHSGKSSQSNLNDTYDTVSVLRIKSKIVIDNVHCLCNDWSPAYFLCQLFKPQQTDKNLGQNGNVNERPQTCWIGRSILSVTGMIIIV